MVFCHDCTFTLTFDSKTSLLSPVQRGIILSPAAVISSLASCLIKAKRWGNVWFSFTQYNETLLLKLDPACFKKIALLQLRRCLMAPLIPRLISRLGNRAASVELAHSEPGNGNYCISCLHLPPGADGYGLMDAELGDGPDPRCAIRPVALCHFSHITWVLGSGLRVTDSLPHANE